MRRILLLVCCSSLAACGETAPIREPSAVPRFASGEMERNAETFASLVDQLCIENGDDRERFVRAVDATGWQFEQTQTLDPGNQLSLDVWKASDAQVLFGKLVGDEVFSCHVAVPEGTTDRVSAGAALNKLVGAEPADGGWQWRKNGRKYVMEFTVGSESATKLGVNVEIWR